MCTAHWHPCMIQQDKIFEIRRTLPESVLQATAEGSVAKKTDAPSDYKKQERLSDQQGSNQFDKIFKLPENPDFSTNNHCGVRQPLIQLTFRRRCSWHCLSDADNNGFTGNECATPDDNIHEVMCHNWHKWGGRMNVRAE